MKNIFRAFKEKSLLFRTGVFILTVLAAMALVSLFYMPYDPAAMNYSEKFLSPCLLHPFGTDNFGRDVLSRVMAGLKDTAWVAFLVVLIGASAGAVIGALTGYFGGVLDGVLMRLNDMLTAFPSVLLALVFVSLWGSGLYKLVAALGLAFIPSFVRLVRGEVLKAREADYVKSARLMGASNARIIFRTIFPNIFPTFMNGIVIGFNNAVLAESGLSFLGIGVTPPDASLGNMLSDAQGYLVNAPWCALAPGITIILLILGFEFVSEGV